VKELLKNKFVWLAKWLPVLVVCLGLGGLLLWRQARQESSLVSTEKFGTLLVTPTQQHLGKLNQFEQKDFSFTIKNQGKESLRILKVEHSCGCTESKVDKEILAPGETAQITGRLNAENRVGEFGSQMAIQYRPSSSKATENAKALVGAKAVTLINMPGHLDLGATVLGENPSATSIEVTKGEAEVEWDGLRIKTGSVKSEVRSLGKQVANHIAALEGRCGWQ
jgi:hypothetical protein